MWAFTPTQFNAFIELAVDRKRIDIANYISATTVAMSGDKRAVQRAIRAL